MGICEEKIFERVFKQFNPRIQSFLQSRGLDMDQAADMAQDVFTKLWKNCSTVIEQNVLSYLYTSARNITIDESRKAAVRLRYRETIKSSSHTEDPSFQLEEKEFKERIELAIAKMPLGSREVFLLNRFEDMSYKKIAEHLNLSVKAIEKRMSIALKHMVEQDILKQK